MNNHERQVNIVVSAAKECAPNVTLDRLEEKQYEIHANDETMYLNPLKEVYGVHDETVEDGIILFTEFEEAMGEFIKRIR